MKKLLILLLIPINSGASKLELINESNSPLTILFQPHPEVQTVIEAKDAKNVHFLNYTVNRKAKNLLTLQKKGRLTINDPKIKDSLTLSMPGTKFLRTFTIDPMQSKSNCTIKVRPQIKDFKVINLEVADIKCIDPLSDESDWVRV